MQLPPSKDLFLTNKLNSAAFFCLKTLYYCYFKSLWLKIRVCVYSDYAVLD